MVDATVRVENTKKLPAATKIGDLRFAVHSYNRWSRYDNGYTSSWDGRINNAGVRSLASVGITIVADLQGHKIDDLKKCKGIGDEACKRLKLAAKQADVTARSTGWPWQITIDVPDEVAVGIAKEADEKAICDAASEALKTVMLEDSKTFWQSIELFERRAKIREALEKKAMLEKQIASLESSVATLEKSGV